MFSFGCETVFFNKTLESKVRFNNNEYRIFYEVERSQDDIDWQGKRSVFVRYKIRDEATKNSNFYVYIEHNSRYPRLSMIFTAFPMYFSEINSHSFLQKIILENDMDEGRKIFLDIFTQFEISQHKM